MSIETGNKLNQLLQRSNPGGLYFSSWLKENGYSDQLVKKYRDSGWLSSLSKGVMYRTGDKLKSFSVLESYNEQLNKSCHIAAHSALELSGFNHYVPMGKPLLVISHFAVHGGTAINLFHKDMLRYSVDIDITYIPIQEREESLKAINAHLVDLKQMIEKSIPGIRITHKSDVWKLLCIKDGATVKIEVNGTKRGLIGATEDKDLCAKAQSEFNMSCKARIVSFSELYGGKISAALSRQHPRDLFDCKYMPIDSLDKVKKGLIFCLLGSDKPILESLQPNTIDQTDALKNQFEGMTDIPFSNEDYEATRKKLLEKINNGWTKEEKEFLLSFEKGEPEWDK